MLHIIHWFPNNPPSLFLILLAVIFISPAHPTATRSTCNFVNLRPFVFCQFKPTRMFIIASILSNDAMTISSIKNHASLKPHEPFVGVSKICFFCPSSLSIKVRMNNNVTLVRLNISIEFYTFKCYSTWWRRISLYLFEYKVGTNIRYYISIGIIYRDFEL